MNRWCATVDGMAGVCLVCGGNKKGTGKLPEQVRRSVGNTACAGSAPVGGVP